MLTCYPGVGKKKGMAICEAFAAGCGGKVMPPGTADWLAPGDAFFYGTTPDNHFLLKQAIKEGRTWFYADNAYYFGRGKFFRVSRGQLQHSGRGVVHPDRWRAHRLSIQPWRRGGRHVVIASQSDLWHQKHHGRTRRAWADDIAAELRQHTDRSIKICLKPEAKDMRPDQPHSPKLEELLQGAHALVVHTSSAAVAAVINGVPVFTTAPCCATVMGKDRLSEIEDPAYPEDRERWLAVLAANQWTIAEMKDGTAWRALNDEAARACAA